MLKAAKAQNKYSFWTYYLSKNGLIEVAILIRNTFFMEYQIHLLSRTLLIQRTYVKGS